MSLHHSHSSSFGSSMSTPVHFECYRMCTVLGHLKRYKISCFCTYGDSLLVASSDGALRLFDTDDEKAVWRERVLDEQFGAKKGVEMMAVVDITLHSASGNSNGGGSGGGEDALLVSIVGSVCRVHTLPSLRSLSLLAESKGCYTFAINATHFTLDTTAPQPTIASFLASSNHQPADAPLLLCLANKRKQLLFYQWKDSGSSSHSLNGDFQLVHTVPVDHTIHSMTFSLLSLVAGSGRDYVLVKLEGGRAGGSGVRLFDCGKKAAGPVSCLVVSRNRDDDSTSTSGSSNRRKANASNRPVEEERELVLIQDARGICINEDGQPSRKDPVNFSDLPLQLASAPPYLFALLPSGIEVRQARSSLLAQSIATKEGQAKWMEARRGCVYVGGSGWARCVYPIPLREVVDECVRAGQYREAMGMVQLSDEMQWRRGREERDERLNELHTLYAYELFNKGDYQQAMMYFQQSNCDPTTVISLFPDVLPSSSAELRHMMDGVKHPVRVTSAQGEQTLLAALEAVISYLAQVQVKIQRQQAAASSQAASSGNQSTTTPLARLIDTVLLKAYLLRDIPLLPFLQQPNACDVEECSAILRAYEKYPELVCLYQQHGYHQQALELLASIGQASLNTSAPLKPAQQAVAGLSPSIDYFQQLIRSTTPQTVDSTLALITQYSRWLFQADPLTALTIFTAEHDERGSSTLPPQSVLEYLRQVGGRDVCIDYLESLIDTADEQDSAFHNELVFLYLDSVLKLMKQEERAKSQEVSPALSGTHTPNEEKEAGSAATAAAVVLPAKKRNASSTSISRRTPASLATSSSTSSLSPADTATLLSLRRRLLSFLRRSTAYNPERLLSKFPRHHLLEERCVLLSRVGQHEEALRLLAHQLGDTEAAERYCVEVDSRRRRESAGVTHSDDNSNGSDGNASTGNNELFLLLLQVYLRGDSSASLSDKQYSSTAGEEKRAVANTSLTTNMIASLPSPRLLAAAVALLTRHFQHISPVAALSLLPSSTPMAVLHSYLCRLLRSLQHTRRSAAITRALYRVENLNARLALLEAQAEYVVVEELREQQVDCPRCHKRIGLSSFARLLNGSLMHYMCHKQAIGGAVGAG